MKVKGRSFYAQKAAMHFNGGYNCAQSVLLTMQEFWDVASPLEPKVASALGGGIGRQGSLCGALTGGVLAIGLRYGANEPVPKERREAYSLARKLYNRFKEDFGSVLCRDLIGYDLTNPMELEQARESHIFTNVCVNYVKKIVEVLIELE